MSIEVGRPEAGAEPAADPDFQGPPQRSQPASGRTLILVMALLSVAAMLVLPVRSWIAQRAGLEELAAQNAAAEERISDLEAQEQQWQDEEYVTDQARKRLNMVNPGEMGLILLDPDFQRDEAKPESQEPTTWYGKLWGSTQNPMRPDVTEESGSDGGQQ